MQYLSETCTDIQISIWKLVRYVNKSLLAIYLFYKKTSGIFATDLWNLLSEYLFTITYVLIFITVFISNYFLVCVVSFKQIAQNLMPFISYIFNASEYSFLWIFSLFFSHYFWIPGISADFFQIFLTFLWQFYTSNIRHFPKIFFKFSCL